MEAARLNLVEGVKAPVQRSIPRWWSNPQKIEALLRARPQYSSDAKAFKACGLTANAATQLYDLLAWGKGEWEGPQDASPAEKAVVKTFARLWVKARERSPGRGHGGGYNRKAMKAAAASALQGRLMALEGEWDPAAAREADRPF